MRRLCPPPPRPVLSWQPSSIPNPSHGTEAEGQAEHNTSSGPAVGKAGVGIVPPLQSSQWTGAVSSLTPETVSEGPGVSRRQGDSSSSALWATSSCTQSPAARFLLRAALLHSWLFSHVWPRWLRNAGRPPVHWPVHRCLEAHLDPVRLKERDDEPHKRLSQSGFRTERQTRQEPRAQDPPPRPHPTSLAYPMAQTAPHTAPFFVHISQRTRQGT